MNAVRINSRLNIPLAELSFTFTRSSGPGGQNVNKLNTRAELRFDLENSPSLSPTQRLHLRAALVDRLTRNGTLIIHSSRFRTQERNRQDCIDKFAKLLEVNLRPPPPKRRPTRPGKGAAQKRLDTKRKNAEKKNRRQRPQTY